LQYIENIKTFDLIESLCYSVVGFFNGESLNKRVEIMQPRQIITITAILKSQRCKISWRAQMTGADAEKFFVVIALIG
jgi:hypothetical protein